MKRMTLLAKKEGLSTSDFRQYWAGPHAALALGMEGISKYTHNRVDKVLWSSDAAPRFTVDGIVELYFSDEESMRRAQASSVGQRHIPMDEPLFLKGWTLCIVETEDKEVSKSENLVKVIVPFLQGDGSAEELGIALARHADFMQLRYAFNWTISTAKRERLWSEPTPPDGFAVFWFDSVASAHETFDGDFCELWKSHSAAACAYLIDELCVR